MSPFSFKLTHMGTLLIVDDDPVLARACSRLYRDEQITLAYSCKQACRLLKSLSFDAVVTDFDLGDGYGTQVLEMSAAPVKLLTSSMDLSSCIEIDPRAAQYPFKLKQRNSLPPG